MARLICVRIAVGLTALTIFLVVGLLASKDRASESPYDEPDGTAYFRSLRRNGRLLTKDDIDFSTQRLIGTGQQGHHVYSVRVHGYLVAMKKPASVGEARMMERVSDHPNIVPFYGFVDDALLMKLVPGGHLCRRRLDMSDVKLVANVMKQIALGLKHIASKGYIFADAKLPNFLYDSRKRHVMLADLDPEGLLSLGKPLPHSVSITPRWAAPETYYSLNGGQVSTLAHTFTIGITLRELLTPIMSREFGHHAKDRLNEAEVFFQRDMQAWNSPLWPHVPRAWKSIVRDCSHPIDVKRPMMADVIKRLDVMTVTGKDPVPLKTDTYVCSRPVKDVVNDLHQTLVGRMKPALLDGLISPKYPADVRKVWRSRIIDLDKVEIGPSISSMIGFPRFAIHGSRGFFKGTIDGCQVLVYVVAHDEDLQEILSSLERIGKSRWMGPGMAQYPGDLLGLAMAPIQTSDAVPFRQTFIITAAETR
ncbi:Protein kinase domain-containing protein [Plasmodiophora brassicae]|uniref:Protein kinase domain-containing protein n=1 Tax=Plasmodiophora brassicae TaxID=37360 RepID=A0A0G4J4S7_PLABS|nr:hypothetical protein PBRA_009106 [Plasmodiophora brassicae]SPR01734.1 unnamed protein product [Plasmodiophora brassicae]